MKKFPVQVVIGRFPKLTAYLKGSYEENLELKACLKGSYKETPFIKEILRGYS